MKILVLGATGMLGYSIFKNLSNIVDLDVYGSTRSINGIEHFYKGLYEKIIEDIDVRSIAKLDILIKKINPDIVINCIGLIKQQEASKNQIATIQINSLLPYQIAEICDKNEAKLIHFSTDCVFDGEHGNYKEDYKANSNDLYGKSKHLGEVTYYPHLTLRTSIIGHELKSSLSLIDWFLSQKGEINGYSEAYFSGMPTCYIAKILGENINNINNIFGLYHLAVDSIDKYSLLKKVAKTYYKKIKIKNDSNFKINRSLNGMKLNEILGIEHISWDELVNMMNVDYKKNY